MDLIPVTSVLDVGCGWGTWLSVFSEMGVRDIFGIDGEYVDRSKLLISEEHFFSHDLRIPFDLRRRFDLVIALEVAEHLPSEHAKGFVSSLCVHSDKIVFSAAIPGQGGQNHVNEQWSNYWNDIFDQHGYQRIDALRPLIWSMESVDVWYRQNIFLYAKGDWESKNYNKCIQIAEIHPDLWKMKIDALNRRNEEVNGFDQGNAGIRRSFKALLNALMNWLWRRR